ncbi:MAG: helix-turn-helix domain-containing protein [Chloroflexota bacterium]
MQTLRSELPGAEAKDARRGLPQRIYESLSAFGNRRGGGVIVFGLEDASFRTLGGLDIALLEHQLTSLVDQRLSYPLRLDFATCEISGNTVLAVAVPECPQAHKPVYYRNKGLVGGSYLRVGNSNHVLAETEVRALLRSSDRDTTDILPAEGAGLFHDLAQAAGPESASAPDASIDDVLMITRVEPGRLWLEEDVGPIDVPLKISRLAVVGWSVSVLAEKRAGKWIIFETGLVYPL